MNNSLNIDNDYNQAIALYINILKDSYNYTANNMIGGSNQYINDNKYNPEILYLSNPSWPPSIGSKINVKDPVEHKWYSGTLKNVIWNSTAGVINLDSPQVFQENSLKDFPEYNEGQNHYLLVPTNHWQYLDNNNFNSLQPTIHNIMDKSINNSPFNPNAGTSDNNNHPNKVQLVNLVPDVVMPNNDIKLEDHHVNNNNYFVGTSKIKVVTDRSNDVNTKVFNHFQNFKANIKQITEDMIIEANNPYYKPLLSSDGIDFSSNKLDINISGNNVVSKISSLPYEQRKLLIEKLKKFEVILEKDIKFPINKNIAINNLIAEPEDELNEGGKIIKHVNKMSSVFTDLQARIHAGYVFFSRKGAVVYDIVTKELVPNLNYFKWQYDKPIDYHMLKYVIFQNEYQKSIKENLIQKSEAESILGLEYIIALQCKSEYMLWCIKKLFMIWYADKDIEHTIRKIKVLINHYRADPFHDFNKVNGILPMIVIYPRYGIENARLLLSKLEYYFSLYLEDNFNREYQEIFYPNSNPTYFLKKNNLLYYTNGSLDLKMYIKESLGCDEKIMNDTFSTDMSKINNTHNVIISNNK